jgi:hypothetical protein
MVVSYKIKQTKYNEVIWSQVSGSKSNMTRPQNPPSMVAEELPTPQVSMLQLDAISGGNEHGTENYNRMFHLNLPYPDDENEHNIIIYISCSFFLNFFLAFLSFFYQRSIGSKRASLASMVTHGSPTKKPYSTVG